MRKEYNVEMDGYTSFYTEKMPYASVENFTLTLSFTPYTYESVVTGLICCISAKEQKGVSLGIKNRGIVVVSLGLGDSVIVLESINEHLRFQKINVVSLVFWGTAGWCSLYVNGKLSSAKQFRRHTSLSFPVKEYDVGRYVEEAGSVVTARHGFFHGKLYEIELVDEYMDHERVTGLHQCYMGRSSEPIVLYEAEKMQRDVYRPVYHLIAPGKWMNEPHAPFYHKGMYHIFYQANPHAPVWDNICWGHLVSRDMMKWNDAGIALYPDAEGLDQDGCWSGSACIDQEGNPVLFYTAGNNREFPNQSVAAALPSDSRDPVLSSWIKKGVILRQGISEGFIGEFRDPFVWKYADMFYMLIGTGDSENGGGNALLYSGRNLNEFTCHGFILDYDYRQCSEVGHVWELPVLLPLKNEAGEHCADILLFCACQIEHECVETYYFLGRFDYVKNVFRKYHSTPRLFDLGRGTFTGGCGMVTPDGRSVVFTIAQGKRIWKEEYESGWAHNGGMPIDLSLKGNDLSVSPIAEVKHYFHTKLYSESINVDHCRPICLRQKLLENRLVITSTGQFVEVMLKWEQDSYVFFYDRASKEWVAKAGRTGERISKLRGSEDLVDIGAEDIYMECYIDHSMIEVYLNKRKSITLRNYSFHDGYELFARSDGKCQVSVWEYGKNADADGYD